MYQWQLEGVMTYSNQAVMNHPINSSFSTVVPDTYYQRDILPHESKKLLSPQLLKKKKKVWNWSKIESIRDSSGFMKLHFGGLCFLEDMFINKIKKIGTDQINMFKGIISLNIRGHIWILLVTFMTCMKFLLSPAQQHEHQKKSLVLILFKYK